MWGLFIKMAKNEVLEKVLDLLQSKLFYNPGHIPSKENTELFLKTIGEYCRLILEERETSHLLKTMLETNSLDNLAMDLGAAGVAGKAYVNNPDLLKTAESFSYGVVSRAKRLGYDEFELYRKASQYEKRINKAVEKSQRGK